MNWEAQFGTPSKDDADNSVSISCRWSFLIQSVHAISFQSPGGAPPPTPLSAEVRKLSCQQTHEGQSHPRQSQMPLFQKLAALRFQLGRWPLRLVAVPRCCAAGRAEPCIKSSRWREGCQAEVAPAWNSMSLAAYCRKVAFIVEYIPSCCHERRIRRW